MTSAPKACTAAEMAELLRERDGFVICGHVNPDGDCLGSQLALAAALRSMGKRVACVYAKGPTTDDGLLWLPGIGDMVPAASYSGACDTFVSVDVDVSPRIGDAFPLAQRAQLRATIDHHATSAGIAEQRFVVADAAANCMNVWQVIGALGCERTAEIAACCYAGLMTDTGRFQFQNTDAACFLAAREMVAAGADPAQIAANVYQSRRRESLALETRMLQNMQADAGTGLVMSRLNAADFHATGAYPSDTETFIDTLRSLKFARVACLMREQDGAVRGSLRARDATDVAAIARRFGGGGHAAAAGFTIEGLPLEEAYAEVRAAIEEALREADR